MARQKKRQRKKQLVKELDQLGIKDRSAAARIASDRSTYNKIHNFFKRDDVKNLKADQQERLKPFLTDPKKLEKKVYQYNYDNKRKVVRDERKEYLNRIGVKDGALRKRLSESKPAFEAYKKKYEEEENRRNQLHMVIFWRDKTQEKRHGKNVVEEKNALTYLSNERIIEHIKIVLSKDYLWSQHGEIEVKLTKDPQSLIKLYTGRTLYYGTSEEKKLKDQEWELVYSGTAQRKRAILMAIGGIIQLLYKGYKREAIGDILTNLLNMPNAKVYSDGRKIGQVIAADLGFHKYEENKKSLFSTTKKSRRK